MTVGNENLIHKCTRKEWTLLEFLRKADEEENISLHKACMRYNESENEVRRENRLYINRQDNQQHCVNTKDSHCGYCGLSGVPIKDRGCPDVARETILQWFVEQNDTERNAYIHHTILCLKRACSSLREQS